MIMKLNNDQFRCVYPRQNQGLELILSIGFADDSSPDSFIYIHGDVSTGKTFTVRKLFSEFNVPHCWIDCLDVYTPRTIFERILCNFNDTGNLDCDSCLDFVRHCANVLPDETNTIIVLDNVERIRNISETVLYTLCRLAEFTKKPVAVVFITKLPWEKFRNNAVMCEPVIINFPNFNEDEIFELLMQKAPEGFSADFYSHYLRLVLSVFAHVTRDIKEIQHIAAVNFKHYCLPINSDPSAVDNMQTLWRSFKPILEKSLHSVFLREVSSQQWCEQVGKVTQIAAPQRSLVELPFYSKYLLIAAYIASYNPQTTDKKYFIKGREKVRKQNIRKSKPNYHLLGPRAFPLNRLLAIFYALVDDPILQANVCLFSQISTLVSYSFISCISQKDPLTAAKYKCLVSFDFIQNVSKTVRFDIVEYLEDFNVLHHSGAA